MILLLQVLLKNRLVSPAAFNKFVEIAHGYGIDDLKIPYSDLSLIFDDPKKYLYNKYDLKKLLPKDVFEGFDLLFPKPKPVPKPAPPIVPKEVKPTIPKETKPSEEAKPFVSKKIEGRPKVGIRNRG